MTTSIEHLIREHWAELVDGIIHDAIHQFPVYSQTPLRQTTKRVERWIGALADSFGQADIKSLTQNLPLASPIEKRAGYSIHELQTLATITERQVHKLLDRHCREGHSRHDQAEQLKAALNGLRAALQMHHLYQWGNPEPTFGERK